MTAAGGIVEIQVTAEDEPLDPGQFQAMLELATTGIRELTRLQRRALGLEL